MPLKIHHKKNPGLKSLPDSPIHGHAEVEQWSKQANILADANEKLEAVKQSAKEIELDAYKKGRVEGLRSGKREGLGLIRDAALTYEQARDTLWVEAIDLVEQCVNKLVGELDVRDRIVRMIELALDAKRDADAVVLKVSPVLASELGGTVHYKHASQQHMLHVQADPNLKGDQCIIMCPRHIVECSLIVQMANLKQTLLAYPPEFEQEMPGPEKASITADGREYPAHVNEQQIQHQPERNVLDGDSSIGYVE